MLPRNQAPKCPNFVISNQLLGILLSPLPHSPGYLVRYRVNHPASNRADYSPRYPVRNPAGYLDDYPASYWAGHLPKNLVSYSEGYPDSNPAGYPANCPDSSPESNPESSWADNLPDYSESNPVDCLPDCWEGYSGSFDSGPVCRTTATATLLQFDDLADSLCLRLCLFGQDDLADRLWLAA